MVPVFECSAPTVHAMSRLLDLQRACEILRSNMKEKRWRPVVVIRNGTVVCVCVCARACVCVCVCVCPRKGGGVGISCRFGPLYTCSANVYHGH